MSKKKKKPNERWLQNKKEKRRKARAEKRKSALKGYKPERISIDLGPKPPREISPAENLGVDQYISMKIQQGNPFIIENLKRIRTEKADGKRPKPSSRLTGDATNPSVDIQKLILDQVSLLVDENLFGRSEMCIQFSSLLALALKHCSFDAKAYQGNARYKKKDGTWFDWNHAWVVYGDYVIDGNTDSMFENPAVDEGIDPDPFWGKVTSLPNDRAFDFNSAKIVESDDDIRMWWKDLLSWLKSKTICI